tara:strand:- start:162 stop:350 length:189 start_codon:yes stop_codon:yes gene_type:complete
MESPEGVKMVPKVNMIPTVPKLQAEQVQIFSTQKVLANLPNFMFDKQIDQTQLGIVPIPERP